jgi:uroporphyrinogen III methyltransferase/synthase
LVRAAVAATSCPTGSPLKVDVVDAYRTIGCSVDEDQRRAVAAADIVTFTSSSTVEHLVAAFGADDVPPVVGCIGPVTAASATKLGLKVDVTAAEHSVSGLVAELVRFVGR